MGTSALGIYRVFGNNVFYLDFKASDNLGNYANGGTDLAETGLDAADQATDSPTNNFCTMNTLSQVDASGGADQLVYSEGNCQVTGNPTEMMGTMATTTIASTVTIETNPVQYLNLRHKSMGGTWVATTFDESADGFVNVDIISCHLRKENGLKKSAYNKFVPVFRFSDKRNII